MNKAIPFAFYGILLFACLFSACTPHVARAPVHESLVIFPPPPDTTRVQYLTHFSTSDDLEGDQGAFHRFLFGGGIPSYYDQTLWDHCP